MTEPKEPASVQQAYRFLLELLTGLFVANSGIDLHLICARDHTADLNIVPFLLPFVILLFLGITVAVHKRWSMLLFKKRRQLLRDASKGSFLHLSHRPHPDSWRDIG